ncbi:hypothetical protein ABB37_05856 [Leptomonas pyrrhocoris]|uniref:Uncharacterized protein n=1 Tax=Leptomonas pyrrhocoris TaxID=157538 RepID=A0A0N0VES3_LEPPY|nr:hypothetical protein ABB37_05856 [Leptomonas pyrrhocoris]KPA78732.1 hypothetical protein ABB37_05856 [Leptomonas pyrrhocoris]|eukprot:XP_015657171.1 hypothetical protein ABB37_05856 [Leptomonas pyrrhocoris]
MKSHGCTDDSESYASPLIALVVKHASPFNEELNCADAEHHTTRRTHRVEHSHTGPKKGKIIRVHPVRGDASSSLSSSPNDNGSIAGIIRSGTAAVAVPIPAYLRSSSNRDGGSPALSLVTEDALGGVLDRQQPFASNAMTSNSGGGDGRFGGATWKAASPASPPPSESYQTVSFSPAPLQPSTMGYARDGYPPVISSLPRASSQGRLPEVQPTLRGIATEAHPAVPCNTHRVQMKPTGPPVNVTVMGAGSSSNDNSSSGVNGRSGSAMASAAHGLPHQVSGRIGGNVAGVPMNGGVAGLQNARYHQPSYPYMMSGGMNGVAGSGGGGGVCSSHPPAMHMMGGPPSYCLRAGCGYPSMLPATSSFRPGAMMGNPPTDGPGAMNYSDRSNTTNANTNSCSNSRIDGGGYCGGLPFMPPANVFYPDTTSQGQNGSYRQGGGVYGSMRGALTLNHHCMAPMVGQPSFLQTYNLSPPPIALGGPNSGLTPQSNANISNNHRTQPSYESQHQSQNQRVPYGGDGNSFTRNDTNDSLSLPEIRPASRKLTQESSQKRSEQQQQQQQRRTSSRFASPRSTTSQKPLFTSEERVQHDRRLSSQRGSAVNSSLPRLLSHRSGRTFDSQRRSSAESASCSCTSSAGAASSFHPSIFKRLAVHCTCIGREAANGLTKGHYGEKRASRPRLGQYACLRYSSVSSIALTNDSSAPSSSFFERRDSANEGERLFTRSDDSSNTSSSEGISRRPSPSSMYSSSMRNSYGGDSSSRSIAQRRRIYVKSLDANVIKRTLQARQT